MKSKAILVLGLVLLVFNVAAAGEEKVQDKV